MRRFWLNNGRHNVLIVGVLVVFCVAKACGGEAHHLYLDALRGDESGLSADEQIALLDKAISLAPARAEYREARALRWISLQQYDRAIHDLDDAIVIADRPYLRYLRGLTQCQQGQPAAGLADFDRAIAWQSNNMQFYRGRALARAATGDARGALDDADRAVLLAQNDAAAHYARGRALGLLARDAEAVVEFDAAARLRPELTYVLTARAESLDRLGQGARAHADREAAARSREERAGCAACLDPFRY